MMVKQKLRAALSRTRWGSKWLALRALGSEGSHLLDAGWFLSRAAFMPVSADGTPLPWYTYAAMLFLEPRLRKDMTVFEYGSGNSTLWWSQRVSHVVSCEHDSEWYAKVRKNLPVNVDYELAQVGEDYAVRITRQGHLFDIVVIDGRDRVACAFNALTALTSSGVVVWDNSDRQIYQAGYDFLATQGFKRLDLWGMGPINTYAWCTSIFYRPDNCLGI